jgi:hypothetical protein
MPICFFLGRIDVLGGKPATRTKAELEQGGKGVGVLKGGKIV